MIINLVDFVDRMLKVIRDILDVDLTTDQKGKRKLDHSFTSNNLQTSLWNASKKIR